MHSSIQHPAHILVVRLSALGDVLFALPAVEALRRAFPRAAIDWLVEDRAATILDLYPGLRHRWIYPRTNFTRMMRDPRQWFKAVTSLCNHLRELRQERYDVVLDFQGNLKSGLHAMWARSPCRAGFDRRHCKERNDWFTNVHASPGPEVVHRIDKSLALVRRLFPEVSPEPPRPTLRVADESKEAMRVELTRLGFGAAEPYLVLHPGTSRFGAFKRWAPDRFSHAGDLLAKRLGLRVLITWGPDEHDLALHVAGGMKSGLGVLAPRTRSIADLAALLQNATAMIGSDSAPLHLAAFLGTRVVALFGPKDPEIYGPRFAPHRIVRTWLPCSPCQRRRCPDAFCMEEISVAQVVESTCSLVLEASATTDSLAAQAR